MGIMIDQKMTSYIKSLITEFYKDVVKRPVVDVAESVLVTPVVRYNSTAGVVVKPGIKLFMMWHIQELEDTYGVKFIVIEDDNEDGALERLAETLERHNARSKGRLVLPRIQ